MIDGLPDWTDDELWRAALDAPRRAYRPYPGLEIIDRPGWLQLIAPSFTEGGLNGVWHAAIAGEHADAAIDDVFAQYAARGLRFRWLVDPESRPLDLADRLARRGLAGEACRIMARATAAPPRAASAGDDAAAAAAAHHPDVTVERVDLSSVETFGAVMAAGWEQDVTPFAAYHRVLLAAPPGDAGLYLARWRGEPAATAAHVRVGRAAYLVGAVVLPAFRGRGVYRELVLARLRDAAAAGIPLAVSLARAASSAPILERLGFATVCEAVSFRSPP